MAKIPDSLIRHWLLSTLFVLCAIFSYTKSPLYGADPTPTPNVSTVPKPGLLFTPTSTPAPSIVIITREAPPTAPTGAPTTPGNDTGEAAPGTQPGNRPSPTTAISTDHGNPTSNRQMGGPTAPAPATLTAILLVDQTAMHQAPSTTAPVVAHLAADTPLTLLGRSTAADWLYLCCGGQPPQAGWVSAAFVQVTGGDLLTLPVMTGEPSLALTVAVTPTLIWQGTLIQQYLVVRNTSALTLTNLTLRQPLPAALLYQSGESDQNGTVRLEAAPGGDTQLRIDWVRLAPATQATVIVTLQVQPATPNGLLFDSRAVITSSEGATAAVDVTLIMPPVELPRFRK